MDAGVASNAEHAGSIERLFSRDVACDLPDDMETSTICNAEAPASSPLERLFSRDVANELMQMDATNNLENSTAPLERLFSRDASEEISEVVRAMTPFERVLMNADSFGQQTAGTQTAARDETMSPTSILESAQESEGETPVSTSVLEMEGSVFSPSGPREGTVTVPEGPRGMERFRTALDAHARPTTPTLDPQLLARRQCYEAALLELNAQFKARWLDFDQSVAMAEPHSWSAGTPGRSPMDSNAQGAFSFTPPPAVQGGVNRLGGPPSPLVVAGHTFDPSLNCPTPPGALTAPASPPLSADDLSAYLASLGIVISAEKAHILVAGYEEPANGEQPRVKMQRLRKDMRVAIARSLRPAPSPRRSFAGANGNGHSPIAANGASVEAVHASVEPLPLSSLAPVNTRVTGSPNASKAKSPAGAKSSSDSDESPCIWSPKIGITSKPLGATPPAIVEAPDEEDVQPVEAN